MKRYFTAITLVLAAQTFAPSLQAQSYSPVPTQSSSLRLAQACAIPDRCFDPRTGQWNGRCPCDYCARQAGACR